MKLYLSGPMTGLPELNFPAFHAEAKRLRSLGYEVVNPAELNPDGGTWEECMRKDIAELVKCDGIYQMPGWQDSRGAKLEYQISVSLGMSIHGEGYNLYCIKDSEVFEQPINCIFEA